MNKKDLIDTEDQKGGEARWLTTFNDLMTLLLTFFVLIFATSSLDFEKIKTFQGAFQSAVGVLEGGKRTGVTVIGPAVDLSVQGEVSEEEEVEGKAEEIDHFIKTISAEPGVRAAHTKEGVVITLENTILFESGVADINPDAFPLLDRIINMINKIPNPVRVEGHTDNIPIHTERFPSNWELSIARAVNVVRYFIERGGVPPQRLSAVGYGESRPIFPNDTPEHRARNRRVEIVLVTEGKG